MDLGENLDKKIGKRLNGERRKEEKIKKKHEENRKKCIGENFYSIFKNLSCTKS